MEVFKRELKAHRKGIFFWSLAMIILVSSSMAKYATFTSTGQSMNALVEQFPKAIKVVFGISGFDLTIPEGYYGVMFLYVALLAGVHAAIIGAEIIAKEERDRTSEFLYVKPISRASVMTSKLLAGLFNIVVLNLVTWISSIYFVNYFAKNFSDAGYITALMISLFILQLIFFSIGAALAGVLKKPKTASGLSTAIMMVALLLMFLINLNDKLDPLRFLSPFKYFDASVIIQHNQLGVGYVILSGLIILIATVCAYVFYQRRDLQT